MTTSLPTRLAALGLGLAGLAIGVGAHLRADADPPHEPPAPGPTVVEQLRSPVPGRPPDAAGAPVVLYDWPLPPPRPAVVRPFEPPPRPWAPGHRGVDLAAGHGTSVLAAGDGVVAFAGAVAGRGVVSVDHPDGIRTTYEPLAPTVVTGQAVARGDVVGILQAGHAEDDRLHWGARTGPDAYLDPLALLGELPVIRLYPVG